MTRPERSQLCRQRLGTDRYPTMHFTDVRPQQLKTALFFDDVVCFPLMWKGFGRSRPRQRKAGMSSVTCLISRAVVRPQRAPSFIFNAKHNKRSGFPLLGHQTFTPSIINVASSLARRGGPREREAREKHAFSESDSSLCVFCMCSFIF